MTVALAGMATRGTDYRLGGGSGGMATFTVPARWGSVEIPLVIVDDKAASDNGACAAKNEVGIRLMTRC